MEVQSYFNQAMQNEAIFREVLRDLRERRKERICGNVIPANLETEAGLDSIFEAYSDGYRNGKFTIVDFRVTRQGTAEITFQSMEPITGCGAKFEYKLLPKNKVRYYGPVFFIKNSGTKS